MDIKELRTRTGLSQSKFASKFYIPVKTLQRWEQGANEPPEYIPQLIESILDLEDTLNKYIQE